MNKTIFALLILAGCSNQASGPEHPKVNAQLIDESTQTEPQAHEVEADHPCWDAVKGVVSGASEVVGDAYEHAKEKGWDKKAAKATVRIKETVVETAQEVWGAAKGYVKDAEDKD